MKFSILMIFPFLVACGTVSTGNPVADVAINQILEQAVQTVGPELAARKAQEYVESTSALEREDNCLSLQLQMLKKGIKYECIQERRELSEQEWTEYANLVGQKFLDNFSR